MSIRSAREEQLRAFLDERNAIALTDTKGPHKRQTLYAVKGRTFIVERWLDGSGFEIYVPASDQHDIKQTFDAVDAYLNTGQQPLGYQINEQEAKGEIRIERAPYGVYVSINGKCLAMVDLFYFSDGWKAADRDAVGKLDVLDHGSDFPQLVIYSGNDNDDPLATVRWLKDKVVVWSDIRDAITRSMSIPEPILHTFTVPIESEGEADAT